MKINTLKAFACFLLGSFLFYACTNETKTRDTDSTAIDSTTQTGLKPIGPAPEWGKTIKPEMQTVVEKLASYGDKAIETLSATEARKNHTASDAVEDLAKQNQVNVPAPMVDTTGKEISVAGGKVYLRIYRPKNTTEPLPIILYYHGGGFALANIQVYNASAQALAEQVKAIVISVAYRLAPENKFPTAHHDAFAAYEWAVKNAVELKADPAKIAVVGESAGGNLAANVSIMARDKHIMIPVHQVLIYPIAQGNMDTESYKLYQDAKPLNKPMMEWFMQQYLNTPLEMQDPKIALVNAELKGLPSTTIITAEIDPLNSDGVLLANKLAEAGVKVNSRNYEGVTHEFYGMALLVPEAKQAQQYVADHLKEAFK
ncbi:alpha/beta hydrolase fold domain-containing protein [Pedobacter sp. AW1-32]|uniref:alpha/beta hydrolase fold domain-containing protein n=1 Tax=Pedobacter sp. AW1-32 TaxID=3383026 RepID=UPI003FEDCC4B